MPTPIAVAVEVAQASVAVPLPAPAPVALAPAPSAAPHSPAAQNQEEHERNVRLQARAQALKAAPREVPISDIGVILGVQTKDNGRQEVMYDIGGNKHRILKCTHEVVEKVRAVTEEGVFLGYEPTGEYEFTLKVKYLKE